MTDQDTSPQPRSVYIAGGISTLGRELVRQLVANGHSVTVLTDTAANANALRNDGALPVYGDPSDASVITNNLKLAEVDTIVNLLPQRLNIHPAIRRDWKTEIPRFVAENEALLAAAQRAEVAYIVHASYAYLYADSPESLDETAPNRSTDGIAFCTSAIHFEKTVLERGGAILRAGYLYGGDGDDDPMHQLEQLLRRGLPLYLGREDALANWLRTEDFVTAIVPVVEQQPAEQTYNIVSDSTISPHAFLSVFGAEIGLQVPNTIPAFVASAMLDKTQIALLNTSVALKNDRAKSELGWEPRFPDVNASIADLMLTWRARAVS